MLINALESSKQPEKTLLDPFWTRKWTRAGVFRQTRYEQQPASSRATMDKVDQRAFMGPIKTALKVDE